MAALALAADPAGLAISHKAQHLAPRHQWTPALAGFSL